MPKVIISADVIRLFKTLEEIIDGKENSIINWFGIENYNKLITEAGGDIDTANEWIKLTLKDAIQNTNYLLHCIADETKDNDVVQKRLKAAGIL